MFAGRLGGTEWSPSLKALAASGTPPVYLAVRLALATAVVVMASPHMNRPLRFIGRWIVTFGAIAGIALGTTLPIGMITGLLIGLGSAAIVHLILGSPAGRLTLDQISTALNNLGVEATDLRHAPLQPMGVALVEATSPDGNDFLVKVYGRDEWDGQFLASTWSSMWRRGEHRTSASADSSRWSTKRSSPCSPNEPACRCSPSSRPGWRPNATPYSVSEITGRPFGSFSADGVDDQAVQGIWRAAIGLHELGIDTVS